MLFLRSSILGTQWNVDPQGSRSVSYVDVQDSRNINGSLIGAVNSVDSSNNNGWLFPAGGSMFSLVSPNNRVYVHDERPTFSWRPPSSLAMFDAAKDYSLYVDNGQGYDFSIEGIPAQPRDGKRTYETPTYIEQFINWDDPVLSARMISVTTKSSNEWKQDQHDGRLTEGRRNWKIKFTDNSNTTYELSNEIFADFTSPATSINQINSKRYLKGTIIVLPKSTLYGRVYDALGGTQDDRKVASGIKEFTVSIKMKIWGPLYLPVLTETIPVQHNYFETTGSLVEDNTKNDSSKFSTFSYMPSMKLPAGSYQLTLTAKDYADNSTTQPQTYSLQIR
jgi:hypothetical protein